MMWPFASDTSQVDQARDSKTRSRQNAIDWANKVIPQVPLSDDLPILCVDVHAFMRSPL